MAGTPAASRGRGVSHKLDALVKENMNTSILLKMNTYIITKTINILVIIIFFFM